MKSCVVLKEVVCTSPFSSVMTWGLYSLHGLIGTSSSDKQTDNMVIRPHPSTKASGPGVNLVSRVDPG